MACAQFHDSKHFPASLIMFAACPRCHPDEIACNARSLGQASENQKRVGSKLESNVQNNNWNLNQIENHLAYENTTINHIMRVARNFGSLQCFGK
jgi:hypothetical protein